MLDTGLYVFERSLLKSRPVNNGLLAMPSFHLSVIIGASYAYPSYKIMTTNGELILKKLQIVFQDVFDYDNLTIVRETTAADVSGWNSLAHIRLMVSVEKAFQIRFSAAEIASLKNVGDLIDLISAKVVHQ
jgi:acyl carrier protein